MFLFFTPGFFFIVHKFKINIKMMISAKIKTNYKINDWYYTCFSLFLYKFLQ